MDKSPDAFRTISEVAEWLDIPTHVLRFWESRFAQIKPVKRAGGRRYYRPSDMRLIGGVKTLLHDQGMTIRGVQKMLREHGIKHVSSFSQPLDTDLDDTAAETVIEHEPTSATPAPAARQTYAAEPAPVPEEASSDDQPELFPASDEPDDPLPMPTFVPSRTRSEPAPASPAPVAAATEPEPELEPAPTAPQIPATPDVPDTDPSDEDLAYPAVPGIAARLAALPTSQLAAHNDVLTQARDRLVALRDAQS